MDSDDDEELRQAVALSLQDQTDTSSHTYVSTSNVELGQQVIDLTEADEAINSAEDEELQLAIALSKQDDITPPLHEPSTASNKTRNEDEPSILHTPTDPTKGEKASVEPIIQPPVNLMGIEVLSETENRSAGSSKSSLNSGLSILGIDRKKQEQERLERLEQRKRRAISPPPLQRATKIRAGDHQSTTILNNPFVSSSFQANLVANDGSNDIQYPFGTVKKTWAFGHPRESDIKIEEILQKSKLQLAVLSSFQWDVEWLLRKINTNQTKMIFVMGAKEEETMVFLIDLPRLTDKVIIDEQKVPGSMLFKDELIHFIEAMGLQKEVINSIHNFDFSKTKNIAFIHSIGGSHFGDSIKRTGYCGLGSAIGALGLQTKNPLDVDFITASVGSLNDDFLSAIYLACQGENGLTEFESKNQKTVNRRGAKSSTKEAQGAVKEQLRNHFRIYFPSEETVMRSTGGPRNGGTICFQSKWFDSPSFPRDLMKDCVSTRQGLLMHNKIMFARPHNSIGTFKKAGYLAWAYIGSANLSESAWGKLVKDRTTKGPKLNLRNWECGVLIPVLEKGEGNEKDLGLRTGGHNALSLEVFSGSVPVPMIIPAADYDGRRPWFYAEH
ncbi:MAG: hypothetical protein M1834_000340 [Cirrosporium novae-zelandiae]|nr:MAG: hypothetical protein M1834_000340 [Cirrosporium novae-zelandiae]